MVRIRYTVIKAVTSLSLYIPFEILISASLAWFLESVLYSNRYCNIFFIDWDVEINEMLGLWDY
jgi:hypothetical protein